MRIMKNKLSESLGIEKFIIKNGFCIVTIDEMDINFSIIRYIQNLARYLV